ncbi:universal stress protein [Actinospica sp. MGRD01-02]|uniref:Universal stress protein n=1 Tax=Actinospica acidithermotolerans TaxID=2828514 RepID=A0A941IIC8_9ACTN|nr:universal stress protein [Actinospica acidithermotolerans]MBR7826018.1 universal stress protein [Actinospica acidithermotolerans]
MSANSRRVVVGVSGSPGSLQALRCAVEQARALGATLLPVIAWEPPGGDSPARPYPRYVTDEWADAAEARLLTAFDEGLGGPPTGIPTEPHIVRGRAGPVLVAFADRPGDLLVIGRGRPRLTLRAEHGPVARHCVTRATCPVITVPPAALAAYVGPLRRANPRPRWWAARG